MLATRQRVLLLLLLLINPSGCPTPHVWSTAPQLTPRGSVGVVHVLILLPIDQRSLKVPMLVTVIISWLPWHGCSVPT